ncbi:MAG: hypothetical protein EOO38_28495 [Cytophagaceae bacterium]|nr:MAG: hypothetical protein EOO38_28495 [Cytophagaceae bacterium]
MFVGALVGIANYFTTPLYTPDGSGGLRLHTWWEVVTFCIGANGIWMSILGLLVGAILFVCLGSANSTWSAQRKARFAHGLKMCLFLPITLTLVVASLLAMVGWCLWHGGLTSTTSDLGTFVEFSGIAVLPLGACLWTWLLGRASKRPTHRRMVPIGRLLPLD